MQIKNIKKYFKYFLVILLIIILILVSFFIYKKYNEFTKNINQKFTNIENYFNNKIEFIQTNQTNNTINDNLKDNIIDIENRLTKLENTNPTTNERNIQIIILLDKINNLYYNNNDFSNELKSLKLLSQNKFYNEVLQLDNFLNKNSNIISFNKEYKNLLIRDTNNIVKKFINQNIQIRKIKDSEDTINNNINILENYINTKQYIKAIDFINENKYNDIFKETIKELNQNIEFNKIINNITNTIYNSYL